MTARNPDGVVESILAMFSPYSQVAKQIRTRFGLERAPSCRFVHGRLELLIRGAGVTEQPVADRIVMARALVAELRPLLRDHSKREARRGADRAIAVVFEDEQVVGDGIATSRFSYLASHDRDGL